MIRNTLVTMFASAGLVVIATAAPKMEVPEDTIDFGKTVQRVVLTHDFWIKSVGDDTLRITGIEPGCGCTQVPLKDTVLAPGDSTTLRIIFSTGYFLGRVDKRPYIITNASNEKTYLKVSAELAVEPPSYWPVVIKPAVVDVSQFGEQPRRRARFLIENRLDKDLNIQVVDSSLKSFTVEIPEKVKARDSVSGLIIVRKDAVDTEFEESITIEFDDEDRSRYSIPVKRMYLASSGK